MKVAIMQPYLFPYLGYWQLIKAVDLFVLFDDVNYIKRGWINRNNILVNGNRYLFTIPLQDASCFKKINEISLSENSKGKEIENFLKTLKRAYSKAPYFGDVYGLLENCFLSGENNISRLIEYSIRTLCGYIGINTEIKISSELANTQYFKGEERILDICTRLNADQYINPMGGVDLYSKNHFQEKSLELSFLRTKHIEYAQFKNEFVENLSIIDVLMFNSKEAIDELLDQYELF